MSTCSRLSRRSRRRALAAAAPAAAALHRLRAPILLASALGAAPTALPPAPSTHSTTADPSPTPPSPRLGKSEKMKASPAVRLPHSPDSPDLPPDSLPFTTSTATPPLPLSRPSSELRVHGLQAGTRSRACRECPVTRNFASTSKPKTSLALAPPTACVRFRRCRSKPCAVFMSLMSTTCLNCQLLSGAGGCRSITCSAAGAPPACLLCGAAPIAASQLTRIKRATAAFVDRSCSSSHTPPPLRQGCRGGGGGGPHAAEKVSGGAQVRHSCNKSATGAAACCHWCWSGWARLPSAADSVASELPCTG